MKDVKDYPKLVTVLVKNDFTVERRARHWSGLVANILISNYSNNAEIVIYGTGVEKNRGVTYDLLSDKDLKRFETRLKRTLKTAIELHEADEAEEVVIKQFKQTVFEKLNNLNIPFDYDEDDTYSFAICVVISGYPFYVNRDLSLNLRLGNKKRTVSMEEAVKIIEIIGSI